MLLNQKQCVPCQGGIPPLTPTEYQPLLLELSGWEVIETHHLKKLFEFNNFVEALQFTNQVGALSESEGHHPNISLTWGEVMITIWTHKIDGLTESDFILAAKIDALLLND